MTAADREHPSQADEALRRVIKRPADRAPVLPTDPAARRRAIQRMGW